MAGATGSAGPVSGLAETGFSDVAIGRPRNSVTGSARRGAAPPDPASRGERVTRPGCGATGRTSVTACGRPRFSTEILAAAAGATGAPRFSLITASFASNVGGAGGGAVRATTARETIASGGRSAAAASAFPATRSELRVGTTGIGPRSTGAAATWLTTVRSRTMFPVTTPPETKTFRLTTVMYVLLT
jgi:predicted outer membrane repeat protein